MAFLTANQTANTEIALFGECSEDAVADHMRNIVDKFLNEDGTVDHDALMVETFSEFQFEREDTFLDLWVIAHDVAAEVSMTPGEFAKFGLTD